MVKGRDCVWPGITWLKGCGIEISIGGERWDLSQAVPQTPAVVLMREACYRVIGEASDNEAVVSQFVFADWYNVELRALLQTPDSQVSHMASG